MTLPKLLLHEFLLDESGQDLIEYALVAAVVGLGTVASLDSLATAIGTSLNLVSTNLTANI